VAAAADPFFASQHFWWLVFPETPPKLLARTGFFITSLHGGFRCCRGYCHLPGRFQKASPEHASR
jgi:hypothetical protein